MTPQRVLIVVATLVATALLGLCMIGPPGFAIAANDAAVRTSSAGPGHPNDYLLVLDRRAGPYEYWYGPSSRYGAWTEALAAFGLPTRFREDGSLCRVTWADSRITVEFASTRRSPCSGSDDHLGAAEWHGMTLSGRPWHNVRGLRVGETITRVRKLYPRARFDRARGRRRLVLLWVRNEPRIVRLAVAVDRAGHVASIEVPATWDEY